MDGERQGRKLMAQISMGVASAAKYHTPIGEQRRSEELVRAAMNALRDDAQREAAAPWAEALRKLSAEPPAAPAPKAFDAFAFAGFGTRVGRAGRTER